ncbi:MAG TPA: Ig domain-containing protein [Ferruginibacter sp.]|jgi:hypothetical protein|nr:Ig domain-containing protein [Ferruginibacter sp.]
MIICKNPQPLPKTKSIFSTIAPYVVVLIVILLSSFNAFSQAPVISSSTIGSGIAGATFTYIITASNTPTSYGASSLPTGLTINTSTGVISGTPTTAGNYVDTITAINGSGTGSQIFNIAIISAWSLTGNSGTNPTTNFIGTKDNEDLVFERNGLQAGLLNLSLLNTSWGVEALRYNTSGMYNTSVGTYCLSANSTGSYNTSVGYSSLNASTGGANTSIGANASQHNTSGQSNTVVGANSLFYNLTGSYNSSFGLSALLNNTASYNTALGTYSLYSDTSGARNTAVGDSSLFTNITGSNNTVIGYKADVSSSTVSNAISLGYKASATSNQLAISDSIHTIAAPGLATGAGYVLTDVSGNGNLSLQPNAGSTAWSLTGNSGTNPSTNFIGTTDNKDVIIKMDNVRSGLLDDSLGNTSWGFNALANNPTGGYNTAVGDGALARNTKGMYNTAVGDGTLSYDTSGVSNTAIGAGVLGNTTSGSYNTGIGEAALSANTTGGGNVSMGYSASIRNRTGNNNTSIGEASLLYDTTGSYNVALGANALLNSQTSNNVALGANSLTASISGMENTAVGYNSLSTVTTGKYNTAIGYQTSADTGAVYALSLGYNASATSNQLGISDSIHTIKAKGLPTGAGYVLTDVSGNGNLSLQPNAGSTAWSLTGNRGTSTGTNFLGTRDSTGLQFSTDSLPRMFITSSGNVGIGNITPAYPLDVNGTVRAQTSFLLGTSSGLGGIQSASGPDGNSYPLQFTNNGHTGGWGAGYTFSGGVNGATNGPVMLRIYSIGASDQNDALGVGNISDNFMQNAATTRLAILGRLPAGSEVTYEPAITAFTNGSNYSYSSGKTFGIFLGASGGNAIPSYNANSYGAFIGYQVHPLTNGWGTSLTFSAKNEAGTMTEIMRVQGRTSSVGIGTTQNNPSALLDLTSISQGFLMPRLTTTQKTAIATPAAGLQVYDSTLHQVFYYNGSSWVGLASSSGWGLTGNSGTNPSANFIGTTDYQDVVFKRGGVIAGLLDSSLFNTSIGVYAFKNNTTGVYNSGFGFNALSTNTTGNNNTSVGYAALANNRSGNNNTAIGYQANVTDTSDSYAIAIGYNATAVSNQFALSDSIHTIKAKGLPTGSGYVLTDVAGNGNLSLQPIAGGTTAWSLSGNTPIPGSSYIGSSSNVSLRFRTNNLERMTIDSIGRVGIGTTNIVDTSYNLYVEKGISTRKVKVNIASWSDYVFDADYKLSSLTDVENYIKQNKHLPDVPSANDVEKNGIDLGTNQKILLQKIEELTLYIIDQNKKIEALQDQNDQLQQLKKEVDDLKMLLQKNK